MQAASRSQKLGSYQLGDRLGVGGMAEVFSAQSQDYGRVAFKRILPGLAEDTEFADMFWDEARITSRLDHPNIVRILDYGRVDSQLFMALEYVDGPTLARVLRTAAKKKQPLSLPVLVAIVVELLDALEYVHTAVDSRGKPLKIVHRDVSPGNVMMCSDGHAKLGDFGIVRSQAVVRRTQPGELKGKIGYMSPEQAIGDTVTKQSDLFSVGIILAEFLTLRPLFLGKTEMQTLSRTVQVDLSTWHRHNSEVPLSLRAIVEKALNRDLSARFSSAKLMREALLEVARAAGWELKSDAVAKELRALNLLPQEQEVSGERPIVREHSPEAVSLPAQLGSARRPQGKPIWNVEFTQASLPGQLMLALRRARDGFVELRADGDSLALEIAGGRILSTYDSSGRHPLGRLLQEASLLEPSGLALAIGESRRANLRLGEFLVLHGKLRESVLQRLLRSQKDQRIGPWFRRARGELSVFVSDNAPSSERGAPASIAEVVSVMRREADTPWLEDSLASVMDAIILPASEGPLHQLGLTEPEVRAVQTTMGGGAYEGRSLRSVVEAVVGERIARRREAMFAILVCLSVGLIQAPGFGR